MAIFLERMFLEEEFVRRMATIASYRALREAATYFVSGDLAAFNRAIDLLAAAQDGFAEKRDVAEANLVRGLASVLPTMQRRST